jgi:hypothetical protein
MTRVALLGLAMSAVLAVSACSGDDDPSADPSPTPTVPPSASPYLPVPEGVELTKPGSQLNVGDHAVVAYEPRQDQVGALDIAVTGLEKTSIEDFSAWQLSDEQKKSTPYYVRATIQNVGDTDLGGRQVPLYVVNEENVLLESTPFASSFQPCPSTPFPEKFGPGDRIKTCLVYLAPNRGELEAVSFRPEESFNPIVWEGEVTRYQPPKPEKDDKKDDGKNGKGSQGD